MKNFPDQDQSKELEKRLQGYSEEPDELVWQNIDNALRPTRTSLWIPWIGGTGTVAGIILMALLWQMDSSQNDDRRIYETAEETRELTDLEKKSEATGSEIQQQKMTPPTKVLNDKTVDDQKNKLSDDQQGDTYVTRYDKISRNLNGNVIRNERSSEPMLEPIATSAEADNDIENAHVPVEDNTEKGNDSFQVAVAKGKDSTEVREESPKSEKRMPKRGLSFYTTLTPQLSFQRVIPAGNDGVVISDFYNPSIISSERFGFGIELGIQAHLSKHWEYYGGLSYYQQRQALQYASLTDRISLEASPGKGYIVTPQSDKATVQYSMRNWGANVGLLYNLQGKKLAHKVGGGLSYQKGFNKQISEKYDNSESSYLFYTVFYRNEVRLSAKLRIYVQPTFMHSLYTKETIDAPFKLKPYRAGIGFGVLYDF